MAVIQPMMLFTRESRPSEINDLILSDSRWELARRYGLKSVNVLFDPSDPTQGQIQSWWDSPEGAQRFVDEQGFDFEVEGKTLAKPTSTPQVFINPQKLDRLLGHS